MTQPKTYLTARYAISLLLMCLALFPSRIARAAAITPFQTFDQSPLVQIYGLPAPGRAKLLGRGEMEARVSLDMANNFAPSETVRERIMLDGESYRTTLALSRGFADCFELGLELPIVSQSGGFLDGFIEGWHHFFHLPNSSRADEPRNRLLYRYDKDGLTRLNFTDRSTGIGDLRLTGGLRLYRDKASALALQAQLKFPTGNSARLTGSGSTDFALWVSGDHDFDLGSWGNAGIFGSLGALAKTEGDVLRGQQRPAVGFGDIGAGWSPLERLALKLQLSSHTPFYKGSDLVELGSFSTILVIGGTIAFSERIALDIGVSEDVVVEASPDTSFHLSLTTRF